MWRQEELAREREVKAQEAERHRQEQEAVAKEAEAERRRLHEAYLRCYIFCHVHITCKV